MQQVSPVIALVYYWSFIVMLLLGMMNVLLAIVIDRWVLVRVLVGVLVRVLVGVLVGVLVRVVVVVVHSKLEPQFPHSHALHPLHVAPYSHALHPLHVAPLQLRNGTG
jgi:hypothetical protein